MGSERPSERLAALLRHLDDALAIVSDQVPWADRDGNRVVWRASSGEPRSSTAAVELFEVCDEIRMSDVDHGWFIHPPDHHRPDDPLVPHVIAGVGACTPLGSDGGGSWIVVSDDGRVHRLPSGSIDDGTFRLPQGAEIEPIADSVDDFVQWLLARATVAATG